MSDPVPSPRDRRSSRATDTSLNETTPLLISRTRSQDTAGIENVPVQIPAEVVSVNSQEPDKVVQWPHSVRYWVFLSQFMISLSFGVTQVPLIYIFRLMICDAYYKDHPSKIPFAQGVSEPSSLLSLFSASLSALSGSDLSSTKDRCSVHAIESSTALAISLLGGSNTVFGLFNLFLTTYLIKRIGPKSTLVIQVFFPAIRLFIQNVGVEVSGAAGIIIVQSSQIISAIGGPSGYLLVMNTYISEVVEYEGRTAALGQMTGFMMFGSALGFLFGGIIGDSFGIKAPFRVTFILFMISCIYVIFALPYIDPAGMSAKKVPMLEGAKRKKKGLSRFFGPLRVFAPSKWIGRDGKIRTEYGTFLLAWGVFLGILATGYIPTFLQMYSTDMFGFGTKENGWLIFIYLALRGLFLTVAFPKVISIGRRWTAKREEKKQEDQKDIQSRKVSNMNGTTDENEQLLSSGDSEAAPKKQETFAFDLHYTKFSLIADGLLTLLCTFVQKGWQMYLVAAVLPFASGTGSAAKGTILQMVGSSASSSERTDALAGVSLVENIARLSTTLIFGLIFAAFANAGKTHLVFVCNALVAIVGFVVLLFARFPLEGSRKLEEEEEIAE